MRKLILLLSLVISQVSLGTEFASSKKGNSETLWLEGKQAYAVHITDIKPQKRIAPSGTESVFLRVGGIKAKAISLRYACGAMTEEVYLWHNLISTRPSIHWTIGGVVPPGNHVIGREADKQERQHIPQYIILEPISELKDSIYGGYWLDLLTIGEHKLSDKAIVFSRDINFSFPSIKNSHILFRRNSNKA